MNSWIKRLSRKLWLRLRYRREFRFTPRARRLVVKDDFYEFVARWNVPHFMSFEDRNENEFYLVPDPDSGITSVMLPEEFRS